MRALASLAMVAGSFAAASLTPGRPLADPSASGPPKGDRDFGHYLSSECVTCHQLSGRFDGIPPIVGWPEESFVQIMAEYRTQKRQHAVMGAIAARLSEDEVAALAAYFHSLPRHAEGN